jgi:hypothetical protein
MSYALNLKDIGHFYRQYRRMMTHWKGQFGDDIFDLNYDALVANPEAQFKALCGFLELPWPGRVDTSIKVRALFATPFGKCV